MAATAQQTCPVDARRFAALLAGFDIGNGSEEEAVGKARAMRRMAEQAKMRIVDLLELHDVRKAVDTQMQPARQESPDLAAALEEATALREEVTDRTRDVRRLAELLRQECETAEELRHALSLAKPGGAAYGGGALPHKGFIPLAPTLGAQIWVFEAGAALLAVVLLIASVFSGSFIERRNGNEPGSGKGSYASVVRPRGAVHPVPEHGAVRHRLRSGGTAPRPR